MKNLSMEAVKDYVWIPVIPKLLKNRDYQPQAMGIFSNYAQDYILSRNEFRKALKYCCNWSYYKINKTIDTLESLGLIKDYSEHDFYLPSDIDTDDDKMYIHGFFAHQMDNGDTDWLYDGSRITNLKIKSDFFFKMLSELDDLSIKMMIFLMMNDDFNRNFLHRPYRISIRGESGILFGLGYSNNNKTAIKIKERLEFLKEKGFIDYGASQPSRTRFGHKINGSYMELTKIYRYCEDKSVSMKVPAEMYEELKKMVEEYEGKSK